MPIGFTLPFSKSTGSLGYFSTTDNVVDATRENLRSLIMTNWGDRPMHYNLGCNLREFLFEQIDRLLMRLMIADRILDLVSLWLPFVEMLNLNIILNEDDATVPENGVGVVIKFAIRNMPDLTSRLDMVVQ